MQYLQLNESNLKIEDKIYNVIIKKTSLCQNYCNSYSFLKKKNRIRISYRLIINYEK